MIELNPGSRVYIYPSDLEECLKTNEKTVKGSEKHGRRMAKMLMNKFFSKTELRGAAISPDSVDKKYWTSTLWRPSYVL